jgi:aspartate aminotransferase
MSEALPALSPILDRFKPSAISEIFSLAARLKAEGRKIYDLSTGEPDFHTPRHIRNAAAEAMAAGDTKYSPTDGTFAMKAAVSRKFQRDNSLTYTNDEIVIANGAKPLLADAIRTIASPGCDVILAAPCWPSHIGMIEIAGASPRFVRTNMETGFKMTPAALAAAMTPATRAVLLCSPSNPTGATYSATELAQLAEVLGRHPDVWIVSDDLYEHILFDGRSFSTIAQVAPELRSRTLTVNGVSKAYAMTGWRIGYAAGPQPLIGALRKVMSQTAGCPSSIGQAAAIAALDGPQDFLSAWVDVYQRRRDRSAAVLNKTNALRCAVPEGAFYLYPWCGGLKGKVTPGGMTIGTSADFVRYLLEDWSVAVVPGAAFEGDPNFRISFATADADLDEGIRRIAVAVEALSYRG